MAVRNTTFITFITTDGNYTVEVREDRLILKDSEGVKLGAFDQLDEAVSYAYGVAWTRS